MLYNLVDKFLSHNFSKIIAEELNSSDHDDLTVFDVGCFQGSFSRSIKNKLKKKTNFFLFDPNPNLKLTDFEVTEIAFSDIQGNQDFFLNKFFPSSGSSLNTIVKNDRLWNFTRRLTTGMIRVIMRRQRLSRLWNEKKNFDNFSVKTNTLDDFCKNNKIEKIDLLKIDTEGSEMKVLNGGKNILNNVKIILVEVLDNKVKFNEKYLDVINLLEKTYNFKKIDEKNIWSVAILSNIKAMDILFIKKGNL